MHDHHESLLDTNCIIKPEAEDIATTCSYLWHVHLHHAQMQATADLTRYHRHHLVSHSTLYIALCMCGKITC